MATWGASELGGDLRSDPTQGLLRRPSLVATRPEKLTPTVIYPSLIELLGMRLLLKSLAALATAFTHSLADWG